MKLNVSFLQLSCNTLDDPLIIKLRMKFGMAGFGCYVATKMYMRIQDNYSVDLSCAEAIQYDKRFEVGAEYSYRDFLEYCVDIGLFEQEGDLIFDRKLIKSAESKAEQGRNAANARWQEENKRRQKQPQPQPDSDPETLPEWKKDFEVYKLDLRTNAVLILDEEGFIAKLAASRKGIDIKASIQKAILEYWSTEKVWKRLCNEPDDTIDWHAKFTTSLDIKTNLIKK